MIVQVTDSACRDILAIAERLARSGTKAALGFVDGLDATLALMARRLAATSPDEPIPVDITHVAYGRYLVFLAISAEAATVLHVSDAGAELETLIVGFGG